MKKLSLIVILFCLLSGSQKVLPNYFVKQVIAGVAIGGIAQCMNKTSKTNKAQLASVAVGCSLVATNFFYDALTADTAGKFFKACISTPFVAGVAFGTAFVIDNI